jgi:hypothetical protein
MFESYVILVGGPTIPPLVVIVPVNVPPPFIKKTDDKSIPFDVV